jgi:hypothetical protein
MATPCKNEYEIIRRRSAYIRLCDMKGLFKDMPPIQIYGIDVKGMSGAFTLDDLLNCIDK